MEAGRAESAAISIHVPRAGDDAKFNVVGFDDVDFNPRPPCGGRPVSLDWNILIVIISIHVPRAGDDGAVQFCKC